MNVKQIAKRMIWVHSFKLQVGSQATWARLACLPFPPSCTTQLARAERRHEVAAAAAEQAGARPVGAAHHVACRKK